MPGGARARAAAVDSAQPAWRESNAAHHAATLLQEIARVFNHLGVRALRASVVDMLSNDFRSTWSIDDAGAVSVGDTDRPLDSVFHAGSATMEQLALTPGDDTIVRKLSPRRWAFAWRLEGDSAVVGEVQFHDRRDAVSQADAALIRLVCSASLDGGPASAEPGEPSEPRSELVWPHVERRGQRKAPRSAWLVAALLGATALLAAWLALVAVPGAREVASAQQAEIEQQRSMADATMVQELTLALASGDYGDLQSSLSSLSALGYFRGAVVVNANERVVAITEPAQGARIGEKLTPAASTGRRILDLGTGPTQSGQLWLLPDASATPRAPQASAVWAAALMTLAAALASAGLLVWRLLRPER